MASEPDPDPPPWPDREAAYRQILATLQARAKAEPDNAAFQRDLAFHYVRMASLVQGTERHHQAETWYRKCHAILEALVAADPDNTIDQGRLAISWVWLGELAQRSGRDERARARYREALAIRQRQAAARPNQTMIQADLADLCERLATVERDQERIAALRKAATHRRTQYEREPAHLPFAEDLATTLVLVAQAVPEETELLEEAAALLSACEAANDLSEDGADLLRWLRQPDPPGKAPGTASG